MGRMNLLNGKIEWLSKYLKSKELGKLPSLYEFGVSAITMGEAGSFYFFQKISSDGEIANATISADVDFAELLYWEAFLRAGELNANVCEYNAGYAELLIERYDSYHTRLLSQALATLGCRAVPRDERDYGILSKNQRYGDIIQNARQICFSQPTLRIEMLAQHESKRKKAEALFNKGVASKKDGKSEKYLLKSAEYTYSPAYTALAELYERMGQKDKAMEWHEKAAEEPYFRLESLKWLADFYKDTQKEIEYLEKIADYYCVFETPEDYFFVPEYARILFRLAKCLVCQLNAQKEKSVPLDINKVEKAEKCFVTIISLCMPADEADESELLNQARLMYAWLLFDGEIMSKNERLAYTLYRLSTSVDNDLSQRMERYRENELVRLDELLTSRINKDYKWLLELKAKHDAYIGAKKLESIKADKEAAEETARVEALRIESEKKSKDESERKQKDFQQMRDSFKLCDDAEFERPKGGRISTHEKAVELYKNALKAQQEQDIMHILMEASKLGHPKAMASLAHYYTDRDSKKAGEWMLRALDAGCGLEAVKGVNPGLDFDTAFAYANDHYGKNQDEKWAYGIVGKEALCDIAQKKFTAE